MTRTNTIADGMCALKNAGDTGKSLCVPSNPQAGSSAQCSALCRTPGTSAASNLLRMAGAGRLKVNLTGRINKCGAITPRFSVTCG